MLGKRGIDNLTADKPKYTCGYCGYVSEHKMMRCAKEGCPVRYCSKACQEGGWPRHRPQCKGARKKAKECPGPSDGAGPSEPMQMD